MLLTSGPYFICLIAIFFIYWSIAERVQWRVLLLALVGYLCYLQTGITPLLILFGLTVSDYTISRLLSKIEDKSRRKYLLALSLTIDVGTLLLFKYANFFLDSLSQGLSILHWQIPAYHLKLIVPLGISFFIFQSIAYVVDVYRRDVKPAESLLDYIAFVSFFPTMIAGPILRAKQFLPQLRNRQQLTAEIGGQALFLIAIGLIKKIAIADYLSANFVDRVFDFPERFSALEVLVAIYGYALQIYADFSGYSDIAIGSALLLGYTIPANFNLPYLSRNLPEFWRRWHISLSSWLRDYLFFSIVGPRARNTAVLYAGLVATMLIGGLWHGATWTYVFWGLLHGVGLVISRVYETARKRWQFLNFNSVNPTVVDLISTILTFHFICLTWIFFRAETVSQALGILRQLTTLTTDRSNLAMPVVLLIMLGLAAHFVPETKFTAMQRRFSDCPALAQAAVLFVLAVGLYYVASTDVVPFIYARF